MGYRQLQDENKRLKSENEFLHRHLDEMNPGVREAVATFCERLAEPVSDSELRQLFRNRFDCWTALAGDDKDPDIMAMTENRFVEVVMEILK